MAVETDFTIITFTFKSTNIKEVWVVWLVSLLYMCPVITANVFHSWIYDGLKWKISATAAAFLDHLVEMDETSWLPQRHVIYERVIQKHVIYGFHKYKWFTHSFVAFMSLGSFSQKYSTDNQLVPKILHKLQRTSFIGNSRCVWERTFIQWTSTLAILFICCQGNLQLIQNQTPLCFRRPNDTLSIQNYL